MQDFPTELNKSQYNPNPEAAPQEQKEEGAGEEKKEDKQNTDKKE